MSHSRLFCAYELVNSYELIEDDIELVRSGNELDFSRQRMSDLRSGYISGLTDWARTVVLSWIKMPANFMYNLATY